jgi:hypothetical protein
MTCSPDPMFPLVADIYYATTEQSAYGNVKKTWVLDKSVACSFSSTQQVIKKNIKTEYNITNDLVIVGRVKADLRISDREESNAVTNIIITNVRKDENHIYTETSGPRAGRSTIFEIASLEPFVGPFAEIEHYTITLRRSENQAVDL